MIKYIQYFWRYKRVSQSWIVSLFMAVVLIFSVALFACLYHEDTTVIVKNIGEFEQGNIDEIEYSIQGEFENSDGTYVVQGWCIKPEEVYDYYDYGLDLNGKGVYNHIHLACVNKDEVYVLPTKLKRDYDNVVNFEKEIDYGYYMFYSQIPKDQMKRLTGLQRAIILKSFDGGQMLYYLD